ncbi:chromate efflux transporter [Streptomyces rubellomurinus]|uniref:Chromate transporter n=1 Tax=Streptomyces rubellomurinus (strain ATCC 31215) TaxID=359131 RepID=A0A0F2T681_STRR3|nr:chromate efflux transporter [Streptomyces rubellomurinus]KJS57845.1 chromate transporter [Streptomyces rubellomurinus]
MEAEQVAGKVGLATIARAWGRIGCTGFGGPPTHIALLRRLCVERTGWITAAEFEDGIAATNLLPGPASTQLAILTAWRLRGIAGALVGGAAFILPGLALILVLAALFLAGSPPLWVRGAAAGAGAAVAAVAVQAAVALVPASWKRAGARRSARARWTGYVVAGGTAAVLLGPWMVLVLVAAGLSEVAVHARRQAAPGPGRGPRRRGAWPLPLALAAPAGGGLLALAWVAFKVGALSYGGGFVIIPLMQADAVDQYHWMTDGQFLNAVALGQITPGPVVQTVAVVGYAAAGVPGGLLAAVVAFAPSFLFVTLGGPRFDALRAAPRIQAFFGGASAAVIGAIAGSAVPLAMALQHAWQYAVLASAALWLLAARRGVVGALLGAGALGVLAAAAGRPVG